LVDGLTSFCARLYGRRSARNRALKAVGACCAMSDPGVVSGRGNDGGHG